MIIKNTNIAILYDWFLKKSLSEVEKDKRYEKTWENVDISISKIGFRNFSKTFLSDIPYFVTTSHGGYLAFKKN